MRRMGAAVNSNVSCIFRGVIGPHFWLYIFSYETCCASMVNYRVTKIGPRLQDPRYATEQYNLVTQKKSCVIENCAGRFWY